MKRLILICIGLLSYAYANDDMLMDIGVYRDSKVSKLQVKSSAGVYHAQIDSLNHLELSPEGYLIVSVSEDAIRVTDRAGVTFEMDTLTLKGERFNELDLKPLAPVRKNRVYRGGLQVVNRGGYLTIVNQVRLGDYLAGVLESETGAYQSQEYYKVQAIISRTYAMNNINKHRFEGFMLTDLVNCQVYKQKCKYNKKIYDAVAATDGLVIVDENLDLINAVFFSNSGGQTANAEDVWTVSEPYLKSVYDPYSKGMLNSEWTKTIDKSKWLQYLANNYQFPVDIPSEKQKALSFTQEDRAAFFIDPSYGIPLRDIRHDWKLKSTFFSVEDHGASVVLRGKGFGHGVGLSQEGAMNMVKQGFSFDEIIRFYFTGVDILPFDLLQFYTHDLTEY